MTLSLRTTLAALCLGTCLCLALPATAHDTWFEALPSPKPDEIRLALGTGNQFPKQEFSVGGVDFAHQGCRAGSAPRTMLLAQRDTPTALLLRAPVPARGALTCWAQLPPFEVVIKPELIPVYLKEISASPALRDTWRAMAERGLAWRERYVKHARIERFDASSALAVQPVPMGMDIVLDAQPQPPRAGDRIAFQLLRDGQPLADMPVELRSALSPIGIWLRTDAQGRAGSTVPLAGDWLLRSVDLQLSTSRPDEWESRFMTLAFRVTPSTTPR